MESPRACAEHLTNEEWLGPYCVRVRCTREGCDFEAEYGNPTARLESQPLTDARAILDENEVASFLSNADRLKGSDEALDFALYTLERIDAVLRMSHSDRKAGE